MLKFFKKSKLKRSPVEFTALVKEGADFVIIFGEDTYLNYEILQYCASWDKHFRQFTFFFPVYSKGFFSHIKSFTNAQFHELGSETEKFSRAIILNLSNALDLRNLIPDNSASLVIAKANQGNLQFLPDISDARELFTEFSRFFGLQLEKGKLEFEFSEKAVKNTGNLFFQNKFLNFLLDSHSLDQNTLKQVIISIKQNFPSNIYLNGEILKKHEFINLKNLPAMTLLEKYLFSANCDLLISDDLDSVKIFRDLNLHQLLISETEIPASVTAVNTRNLHVIKDAIAAVLEK